MLAASVEEGSDEFIPLHPSLPEAGAKADQEERSSWPRRPRCPRCIGGGIALGLLAAGCIGGSAGGLRAPVQGLLDDGLELAALNKQGLDLGEKYFHQDQYRVVKSAVGEFLDAGAASIVVACFSPTLLDMTNNWLCSMASHRGNVKKAAVLLFAMDGSCDGVSSGFRDAGGAFLCVPVATREPPRGTNAYQSGRYTFMCGAKLALFSWAMHAADQRGRGLWFLFSDVDIVIRRDVFLYMESHAHTPDVHDWHWPSPNPPELIFQRSKPTSGGMNTGFYFARTGIVALRMFKGALEYLQAGRTTDGADQGAIQMFFNDTKEAERWPIGLLPDALFPTGLTYFRSNGSRAAEAWFALHANFLPNPEAKVECLKTTGNWFLDEAAARGGGGESGGAGGAHSTTCIAPERHKNWMFVGSRGRHATAPCLPYQRGPGS